MAALVLGGEVVFLLPFVFPRIFRPTILDVYGLTNFELGTAFSVYGIVALLSYFLGGPLADRFPAKYLMSIALTATACGGVIFALAPSHGTLLLLYGFWGCTTILLFWAAMLRSTRVWGGNQSQGRAFGILDAGRGLVSALIASAAVFIFDLLLADDLTTVSIAEKGVALNQIIWIFSGITFLTALIVWLAIPARRSTAESKSVFHLSNILMVLKKREIWLQAIIVLCAYSGYKATDDFSLYARDVFNYDDVDSASVGMITFWMRPVAALAAGILADRFRAYNLTIAGFIIMAIGAALVGSGILKPGMFGGLVIMIVSISIGVYGLRGVYFALVSESGVPVAITGTAIGIISTVGFLPDVFMGPLMGFLIDENPGATGHQYFFMVVLGLAIVGLTSAIALRRLIRKRALH